MTFVAFVCIVLAALAGRREWVTHRAAVDATSVAAAALAQSAMLQTEGTIRLLDTVLVGLAAQAETGSVTSAALLALKDRLSSRSGAVPDLRDLVVVDQTGTCIATSPGACSGEIVTGDRSSFSFHRDTPGTEPHLDAPTLNRASGGRRIVTVSRRLQHADGGFSGIVLASIDAAALSENPTRVDVPPGARITVLLNGATILADLPNHDAKSDRAIQDRPGIDESRISATRRSDRFPLIAVASLGRDDALSEWRDAALLRAAAVAAVISLIAWLGVSLTRLVRRSEATEAALAVSEEKFRLMAENSSDMVVRVTADGLWDYVSPASLGLLGHPPEALHGRPVTDMAHPEDRPQLEALLASLQSGATRDATFCYRSTHQNGSEVWIEAAIRVSLHPETGQPDGCMAIARDMTERKRLEDMLTAMARTDALTGLANRRQFDEMLVQEWRRASRQRTPLSLVLIDVDQFKAFNDRYGHQAGDACLRAVAGALAGTVCRSGDLVARYGGEEVVFLLPATHAAEAARLADRARAAVQKLGIAHAASGALGLVTVSAGIATMVPDPGRGDPDAYGRLIEAADAALYAAKRAGRNRVISATAESGLAAVL